MTKKVQANQYNEADPLHLPREYAWVNIKDKPIEHSCVEKFKINWNSIENYKVI